MQLFKACQEKLQKLCAEEAQLNDDRLKYAVRLEKYTRKLQEMKANDGKPEYFLQFCQLANHYVEQLVLEKSAKEQLGSEPHGEPDPDRMTYEVPRPLPSNSSSSARRSARSRRGCRCRSWRASGE